jgi:hypothetical protein
MAQPENGEVPAAGGDSAGCLHCSRFFECSAIYNGSVTATEYKACAAAAPGLETTRLALRYVCWRRSILLISLLPYILSVVLKVRDVINSAQTSVIDNLLPADTRSFDATAIRAEFETYNQVHVVVQVCAARPRVSRTKIVLRVGPNCGPTLRL